MLTPKIINITTGTLIIIAGIVAFVYPHILPSSQNQITGKSAPVENNQSLPDNSPSTNSQVPNNSTVPGTTEPTDPTTPTPNTSIPSTQTISDVTSNWSGYASTGGTYTSVSGSWSVPQVTGNGYTSADATWIGIGGITGSDLIQVGTQNVVDPSGQVTTSAFYELLPDYSINLAGVTVNPGDSITASIVETSANYWTIRLVDNSNGGVYDNEVYYASSLSSAEWIEEDPSDGADQEIPLDNFGTIDFTSGLTTDNGNTVSISNSNAQTISMVNELDQPLDTISSLDGTGSNFTITRSGASSGSSISQFNVNPGRWVRRGHGIGREGFGSSFYPEQTYIN